jgi:chemotaxis protein CheZ
MTHAKLAEDFGKIVEDMKARQSSGNMQLVDVLSLAEIMVGSMQSFFTSVDTRVYAEFRSLSDHIAKMKGEIAALQPDDINVVRIPRAGQELDAIVKQTESATNTIMENAEKIMAADTSDPAAYKAEVDAAVMQIFEACSFQDITGQRISKVVQTLSYVEERVNRLADMIGIDSEDAARAVAQRQNAQEAEEVAPAMHGPVLAGEGIDQADIDALFD